MESGLDERKCFQENKKRWTVEKDLLNLKRAMGEIIKARKQIT
jgi:hypothetical protein